jgi:hypothetical protein
MDVDAGPVKEGHECDVSRLGPRHLQVSLGPSRAKDLGWAVAVMSSVLPSYVRSRLRWVPTTSAWSSSSDSDSVTESSTGEVPRSVSVMS